MSLVPISDTAKFFLLSASGVGEITLTDKGKERRFLIPTGSGIGEVVADESLPLTFLTLGASSVGEITLFMRQSVPLGEGSELQFSFSMGTLSSRSKELRADYGVGVLQSKAVGFSFSSALALETVTVNPSFAWDLWVPERKNVAHTFAYDMGLLTEFDYLQGFSCNAFNYASLTASRSFSMFYKAGIYSWFYRALGFLQGYYVASYRYPTIEFNYEARNWERISLDAAMTVGVLHKDRLELTLESTMGVLGTTKSRWSWACNAGQISKKDKGFGFIYSAVVPWEARIKDIQFSQWVRNEDFIDFTMSWGLLPTSLRKDFGYAYSQAYVTHSYLGFSFARDFSVVFVDFGFFSVKERHLLHSTQIKLPFGASSGVALGYSLNALLVAGMQLSAKLEDPLLKGVVLHLGLSRLVSGLNLSLPLHRLLRLGVELPAHYKVAVKATGVQILLPFTKMVDAVGVQVPSPFTTRVTALRVELPLNYKSSLCKGVTLNLPVRGYVIGGAAVDYTLLPFTLLVSRQVLSSPLMDTAPRVMVSVPNLPDPTGADTDGISFLSARIETDEGSFGWTGTFELESLQDLKKFKANSLFFFTVGADTYQFMVDAKNFSRTSITEHRAVLKGVSPAVQLTAPRASRITKTWNTPMMSHDLIREMTGDFPVEITILNWPIPANRYGVSLTSPMEVIRQIAVAVGGEVDSLPNGTLRVRPKFPIPTNQWASGMADHHYSEEEDIFSLDNQETPLKAFDKFRVMDAQSSVESDRLEFKKLTDTTGEIRVYPYPWRTSVMVESTTNRATVGEGSEEYRDEEETIEIFKGSGSVRFPVTSVNSVQWMGAESVGVVAGYDSTKVSTASSVFSMLKIGYKTRCLVFPVQGEVELQAQFVLRNL